jgi:hypothetical protein
LAFLVLLLLAPAVRADQFTLTGHIPDFHNSGNHYTFATSGTGSPLGDVLGRGQFDLDSTTGQITNGVSTYVDGNGDFLQLDFSGTIDATGAIKETFTIAGGTGSLSGATGSGTVTGQLNADGSVDYTINGTINLP